MIEEDVVQAGGQNHARDAKENECEGWARRLSEGSNRARRRRTACMESKALEREAGQVQENGTRNSSISDANHYVSARENAGHEQQG